MFRNTGANAVAKNQTFLAYEDKRDLYCIFVILVDVVISFLVSFSNIAFVVILVDGSVCIPGHVSGTCSCVSIFSGHFRHFVSLHLPLKLFLRPTFWFLL